MNSRSRLKSSEAFFMLFAFTKPVVHRSTLR